MPRRIVTLTVNPAVDLATTAKSVQPGHKIRTFDERYDPGGGGINVAKVISELGGQTLALFASGGVTGRFVEEMLTAAKVPWHAVPIRNACRVCVTVHDQSKGLEYRFVPAGPQLTESDCANIVAALREVDADWVVASGSLAPGVPPEFYSQVARMVIGRGAKFALDTSGQALKASLGQGISLLKPSLSEFASVVGQEVRDLPGQMEQAKRVVQSGAADMIALTLGADGAILATVDEVVHAPAIPVSEKTGVGAGDSFLAGLVFGLAERRPPRDALRLALACGAAAVQSIGTAAVRRTVVDALLVDPPEVAAARHPRP
ncbi:MAG: 1-phosphofructokinase family hexose kinase [Reyranella sp.]|nr:1-phosphofructokinase family hexose kinase [Reyranella sp.]MBL6651431.1 1-phosphofructokinase family hexose kinase [Reyranella sp.]